jgi:uncharacterized repeat protein (TIGR01451 family)
MIINNIIQNNYAANNCGGICLSNSNNVRLANNLIRGNIARQEGFVGRGAGLWVKQSQNVQVDANIIVSNTARGDLTMGTLYGGGVFVDAATTTTFTNNQVLGNSANQGSGFFIVGAATITLTNNTMVGNMGEGVVFANNPTATVVNNIIADHTVGISGTGTIVLAYNDVWNCSVSCYKGIQEGISDLSVDPGFVNAAAGDYHLRYSSPLVDAGQNEGAPAADFEGDKRPLDGNLDTLFQTDIGADEFVPAPALDLNLTVPALAQVGQTLAYTIHLTNSGNITLTATITALLPPSVATNEQTSWQITLPPQQIWEQELNGTVGECSNRLLIGEVVASANGGVEERVSAETAVTTPPCLYLPIIRKP